MALDIATEDLTNGTIIRVSGEVDLYTSPELRNHILKALRASKLVQLDLRDVAYMDSSGVATLVEGLKTASKSKATFQLVSPSDAVAKVLQLSRLDSVFDIVETESDPA